MQWSVNGRTEISPKQLIRFQALSKTDADYIYCEAFVEQNMTFVFS